MHKGTVTNHHIDHLTAEGKEGKPESRVLEMQGRVASFLSENALERLATWISTTPVLLVGGQEEQGGYQDDDGMDPFQDKLRIHPPTQPTQSNSRSKARKTKPSEDGSSWCDADSMEALDGTTVGSSASDFTADDVLSVTQASDKAPDLPSEEAEVRCDGGLDVFNTDFSIFLQYHFIHHHGRARRQTPR